MEQFGQYRLEELIGRGGMGEVFRAYDTVRERWVAVKRLPANLAADAEFQARFRKESALASRLAEPHIIPIHDFGEIDGRLYIDMRLVDGRDLGSVLQEDGALTPARAGSVVGQVASALDSAHADGLVHRDVKPSNVLLTGRTGQDFVYLVDFGIARTLGAGAGTSLTVTGATVGTLDYMAPERFLESGSDHRVDVYALACLFFEILTGHKPFRGDGLPAMINAHLNMPPPRPSSQLTGLPPALDEVVARGMAKRADDRYPSAGMFADAVLSALSQPGHAAHAQGYSGAQGYPGGQPYATGYPAAQNFSAPQAYPTSQTQGPPPPAYPPGPQQWGSPPPGRPNRLPWVLGAVAAVVVLVAAAVVVGPMLFRGSGPTPPPQPPPTSASGPVVPPSIPSSPPTTPVRGEQPVSLAGADQAADTALWNGLSGTGIVWDRCSYQASLGNAASRLDCDNVEPALNLQIKFQLYTTVQRLTADMSVDEADVTGNAGSCDTGGRYVGQFASWDLVCGYTTYDDGTVYYQISWASPDKLIRGVLLDTEPSKAWDWWLAHTPF